MNGTRGVSDAQARFSDRCWLPPLNGEWAVEEGPGGWYVVRPFGLGAHGPYDSAPEAERALTALRTRAGD
jgi:hypothetical protein